MFTEELNNDINHTAVVSLGNYCLTASILKDAKIKIVSHPFDWMVSCINNITNIVNDDFKQFLNKENYINLPSFDGTQNTFYIEKTKQLFNNEIDHQHHNLLKDEDYNYLTRCV